MLIRLTDIEKRYEGAGAAVPALRHVSMHVGEGEYVALAGASGSGKSTLMNVIGLLDRPTAGEYWLNGRDVAALPPRARAVERNRTIGFVFQGFHLLPRLTARENVELPMVYAGVPFWRRKRQANALLKLVGLTDRGHHRPNQLSGGQQQRVAIARALANQPRILLADEPTGNLDSETGAEVLAEFNRLRREHGITVVLVTHDWNVAAQADRMVTLKDGLIVNDARRAAA